MLKEHCELSCRILLLGQGIQVRRLFSSFIFSWPFIGKNASTLLCSQVIEHACVALLGNRESDLRLRVWLQIGQGQFMRGTLKNLGVHFWSLNEAGDVKANICPFRVLKQGNEKMLMQIQLKKLTYLKNVPRLILIERLQVHNGNYTILAKVRQVSTVVCQPSITNNFTLEIFSITVEIIGTRADVQSGFILYLRAVSLSGAIVGKRVIVLRKVWSVSVSFAIKMAGIWVVVTLRRHCRHRPASLIAGNKVVSLVEIWLVNPVKSMIWIQRCLLRTKRQPIGVCSVFRPTDREVKVSIQRMKSLMTL